MRRIDGYTDDVGSAGSNVNLSWRREEVVRRFMVERGAELKVDAERDPRSLVESLHPRSCPVPSVSLGRGHGRRKNVGKASGLASSARAIVGTEAK
jgi:hypothetical protein